MEKILKFMAYCVEIYRENKGLSGKQIAALFTQHKIWDFIYDCYDALHCTGPLYTIGEIDDYIAAA
ncbi:MAG: DUF3791 domain-containing protein [Firmicutes bacterium]|nr:DUF3791 domain-containing protein [Bacillota bacterium]